MTVEQQKDQVNEQDQTKENDESVTLPSGGIDQATAEQKAQASIPGSIVVANASVLEDENGVIVYGIEIKTGNAVHDVKVDAITGAILKSDQDNDKEENGKIEKDSKTKDHDNVQNENENEDSSNHED